MILRQNKVIGCVSQNSDPKKYILRKAGEVRLNASAGHTVNIFRTHLVRNSNSEQKKEPSRGVIQKGEHQE